MGTNEIIKLAVSGVAAGRTRRMVPERKKIKRKHWRLSELL